MKKLNVGIFNDSFPPILDGVANTAVNYARTIQKLYVDYNSPVRKGQILAQIDPATLNAQVEQAKHNLNMVNEQKGKEEDSVLLEVRQYYLSMQEAAKRIETNKVAIQQAEESLNIQKMRYEVGVGTNLDLRDSVLSLDQAKRDSLQALYDYNINKAKLEHSMGRPVE